MWNTPVVLSEEALEPDLGMPDPVDGVGAAIEHLESRDFGRSACRFPQMLKDVESEDAVKTPIAKR